MKYNEFVKELKKQGVIFDERKGHTKIILKWQTIYIKKTSIPRDH